MSDKTMNMPTTLRPRVFTDVVGQPYARGLGEKLGKGIISGQGYILSGPKGCGKTTIARIIAKSLNCENRDKETGNPCEDCRSCHMIESGSHPNVKEINAATSRGISEIKSALSDMNFSISSGYRVYILDEAHMLTREAFSVLLKPMEEPSDGVIFISTTTNIESIPETIISRSPVIPILHLSDEDLHNVLDRVVEKGMEDNPEAWSSITDGDKEAAVLGASGSARQAITNLSSVILHGVSASSVSDRASELASSIIGGDISATLSIASSSLDEEGVEPVSFIKATMNSMLRKIESASDARKLAQLAEVAAQTHSTSSKIVTASRIAYCSGVIDDARKNAEEAENRDKASLWPGDYPSEAQDTIPRGKKNHSSKKSSSSSSGSPSVSPKNKNPSPLIKLDVSDSKVMNRVFDALFSKTSTISKKWMDILDDEELSDIYVDKSNTLIVTVEKPDDTLVSSLEDLFEKVEVKSFA